METIQIVLDKQLLQAASGLPGVLSRIGRRWFGTRCERWRIGTVRAIREWEAEAAWPER